MLTNNDSVNEVLEDVFKFSVPYFENMDQHLVHDLIKRDTLVSFNESKSNSKSGWNFLS